MKDKSGTDRSVKFWRVHGLRNLELLQAAHNGRSFARRLHEGFEVSVIEHGAEKLAYRGSTYIAEAGSVVVINPGEVHAARAADEAGWSYRAFYPTPADMQDAASAGAGKTIPMPSFSTPVIHDGYVTGLLQELHRLLEVPKSSLAQESLSIWVAAQLVSRHADEPSAPKRVGREHRAVKLVQEFIQANFAENITLAEIARVANLSGFHLIRVFKEQIGIPPHAYLMQVRINQARRLVASGLSLAQVASETGFVDQSHLARYFKRLLGLPPGQYARAISQGY